MPLFSSLLSAVLGYLLGSIPTGYLVARAYGNVDLLRQGSGRTGTTNVLRTLGRKAAAAVFLGDFLKGVAAVLVARLVSHNDPTADLLAGCAALIGHNYSLFLGFKGGRGAAAGIGTIAAISPLAAAIAAVLFASVSLLSRYVSLGSMIASASVPVTLLVVSLTVGQPVQHLVYGMLGAIFVIASHRDNIQRLLRGTERKLAEKPRP